MLVIPLLYILIILFENTFSSQFLNMLMIIAIV